MWVWPQTTTETPSPSKMGRRRSSGVRRVNISVSLRGVAWQKSPSPRPGISTWHVGGQPSNSRWCWVSSCCAVQRTGSRHCSGAVRYQSHAPHLCEHLAVTIAVNELRGNVEVEQTLDGFTG